MMYCRVMQQLLVLLSSSRYLLPIQLRYAVLVPPLNGTSQLYITALLITRCSSHNFLHDVAFFLFLLVVVANGLSYMYCCKKILCSKFQNVTLVPFLCSKPRKFIGFSTVEIQIQTSMKFGLNLAIPITSWTGNYQANVHYLKITIIHLHLLIFFSRLMHLYCQTLNTYQYVFYVRAFLNLFLYDLILGSLSNLAYLLFLMPLKRYFVFQLVSNYKLPQRAQQGKPFKKQKQCICNHLFCLGTAIFYCG